MAITLADFVNIWASTSPLTPYSFSTSNYEEGWNFIGSTPPARQMWDAIQKQNDEKMKYIVDNFLPLSGGTMTGGITTSSTDFIAKTNNTTHLTIAGGSAYSNSASLRLAGGEETGQTGLFQLRSQDGVNSKDLIGKPSGEFTWGGSNVVVSGTLQNGHGLLSGNESDISVSANSYATGSVSFGQTFASAPIVVVCCAYGHAKVEAGCYGITTTGFTYVVSNGNNASYTNERINWIAIG